MVKVLFFQQVFTDRLQSPEESIKSGEETLQSEEWTSDVDTKGYLHNICSSQRGEIIISGTELY